jgi:hypothetical protein
MHRFKYDPVTDHLGVMRHTLAVNDFGNIDQRALV